MNARLLDILKSKVALWRQIIWPERKAWFFGVVGAILGTFSNLVGLLLREVHSYWLVGGFALGAIVGLCRCRWRVHRVLHDTADDRTRDAKIDTEVYCLPCAVSRFCLFSFLTILL